MRALLEVARELKVEALVLVDSDLRSIVPEWIELLAGPILKGGYDYVAPLYARHKYDGTITNHIAYPLTRTLYGRRLRQPIGGEFAISRRPGARRSSSSPDWDEGTARFGIDIWMTHHALAGGFAVCQTRLGAKVHDPKDPAGDLGPMFRQVVGTLFRLAGEQAAEWLPHQGLGGGARVRLRAGHRSRADHGGPAPRSCTASTTRGWPSGPVWKRVLAGEQLERVRALPVDDPGVLCLPLRAVDPLPVRRPARLPAPRDRTASALLAGLTGLYFGRTAGFINEVRDLTDDQAERLVEAQAREFEDLKPWLVRAWQAQAPDPSGERP